MKPKTFRIYGLVALATTMVAIALYPFLPMARLTLIPPNANYFLYADAPKDSDNGAAWVNANDIHYKCVKQPGTEMRFCGLNIIFADSEGELPGLDISDFDHVEIDASYHGSAESLRLFFRHKDARYAVPGDHNSHKYIYANIRAEELAQPLSIALDEFRVADWWLYQRDLPRQLSAPQFTNIIALGFDFGSEIPPGEHHVQIHQVTVVGPLVAEKNWYLGIIAFWIVALVALLTHQWWDLHRRSKLDRQRIRALASRNVSLYTESKQYKELSSVDALTGVANRRGIEQIITEVITPETDEDLIFILLDLDHFKAINDKYGHDAGDQILKQVAQLISVNTRDNDHVGRWGGEEFTILCSRTNLDNGFALAEKIRRTVAETPFKVDDEPVAVTASFGVTVIKPDESFAEAFRRADKMLYRAKDTGRNRTVVA